MSLKTETTAQKTAANDDAPKLNRRQAAKVATRAKVIAAAQTLWAEPGTYEFWGIRDIAAHIGMSTGAIFANFASKADLWREAMGYEPPVDSEAVRAALKAQAAAGQRRGCLMALARHQDGLRPIGEALGAVIVGLDRVVAKKAGKTVIQNLADTQGWEAPEEGSERYRMLDLALASRGMGYRFKGGEGAHDAWSLARTCAAFACERDCIDVRREDGVTEAEARMAMTQWGLTEVRTRHAAPGDLLLLQTKDGFHVAIMSAPGGDLSWSLLPGRRLAEARMIHAAPVKSVVESWVGPFWMEQLVAAFSFDTPGAPLRAALRRAA